MAVNSSTVTSKSVRLKAPDGTYHEATGVVYTQSNGEAVFSLSKPFSDPDKGIWEVYTSEQNRIADAAGNLLILNEKIGEFVVGDTIAPGGSTSTDLSALKAKQDAQAEALQKATQSIADLAILVAKGTGGASSTELKTLQDKLTSLDTAKAEKAALDTLDTSVKALTKALADGATDDELAAAIKKVDDAIALIEASLKPLVGRTLYTTLATTNAAVGDSIFIDSSGEIQLLAAPPDGSEIQLLDPWRRIKAGQNNVLLGTGDRWLLADGTYDTTPLNFTDNQLLGGSLTFKYSAPTRSWSAYPVYGSPVQAGSGTGVSIVQHDVAEQNPLPISNTPSVQFHLEGGAGAWIDSALESGWWATVINTTSTPQPIAFDDTLQVYIRDGKPLALATSPYLVPANSSATLQMVENGFKFLQIIPSGGGASGGGDRVVSVVLPLLPANIFVNYPDVPDGSPINDHTILDASGNDITSNLERDMTSTPWRVKALVEKTNLQFRYELGVKP